MKQDKTLRNSIELRNAHTQLNPFCNQVNCFALLCVALTQLSFEKLFFFYFSILFLGSKILSPFILL